MIISLGVFQLELRFLAIANHLGVFKTPERTQKINQISTMVHKNLDEKSKLFYNQNMDEYRIIG